MATAPVISEATLTDSGQLLAPKASKKPVYSVRTQDLGRSRVGFRESTAPAKRPGHVLFGGMAHPRLRLLRPIPAALAYRKDGVVARFKATGDFGVGSSLSAALDDLGKTIAELFLGLSERQGSLGPELERIHRQLSRYVAFRQQ